MTGRNSGSSAALNESTANVTRIDETQFDAEVMQAGMPVVVDFYATWCGPCKRLAPRLDSMAGEFKGRIKFVKVNVDLSQGLARRFEVTAIPTLLFFNQGKLVDRSMGAPSDEALRRSLEMLQDGHHSIRSSPVLP